MSPWMDPTVRAELAEAATLLTQGSKLPQHRVVGVDALLQLAARGELDAEMCGAQVGREVKERGWRFNHVLDSLETAARAGAYATVWDLLATVLPGLLAEDARPRRLGALLSLAAECVEQCGATGTVPGLEQLAGSGDDSLTAKQARRLRHVIRNADSRCRRTVVAVPQRAAVRPGTSRIWSANWASNFSNASAEGSP